VANGILVNNLIAAGLVRPPAWQSAAMRGFGMGGLGKGPAGPSQEAVSASQRTYETTYQAIVSLINQIQGAAREVDQASGGLDEPAVRSLVDDAMLISQDAQDRLSEARSIYELEQGWVESAVAEQAHGGWAFGREFVLTAAGASAQGNRSGVPLMAWNKDQILGAAAKALTSIQRGLATNLGQLRGLREAVLTKVKLTKQAAAQQATIDLRQQQEQAKVDQLAAIRQKIEEDKLRREEEAATRAQLFAEQQAQRAQELEERRQQAAIDSENRRIAMQEQLEQSRIRAEEQRLNAQLQAEAQSAALEQARLQQEVQTSQAASQFQLQLEQQRQAALVQAELSKLMPPPPPLYGAGALAVPGYGMPQGAIPQPMIPPGWDAYSAAAQAGATAAFPQVWSPIGPQELPTMAMPAPQGGWSPGGEMFGMGAMAPGTFSPASAGRIQPTGLESVANFLSTLAAPAANVIDAVRGTPRAPAMSSSSSGPDLGNLLLAGVAIAGAIYVGKKVLGGKKTSRSRSRRRR